MAYLREKHAQQQRGGKGSSGGTANRLPKAEAAKNDKVGALAWRVRLHAAWRAERLQQTV